MSTCNVCGASSWGDQGKRIGVRCTKCGSLERTRVLKLFLDKYNIPKTNGKVLHIAPEIGISRFLQNRAGIGYEPVDKFPSGYRFCKARELDLCTDAEFLPRNHYDLIIHSHVMEHLRCNITAVLYFLHRALNRSGLHIFALPIMQGHADEYFGPLSDEEARLRFGQSDHVRRLSQSDLPITLGMIFRGDLSEHAIGRQFESSVLDAHNIPMSERVGLNGSTVFMFRKDDIRLQGT